MSVTTDLVGWLQMEAQECLGGPVSITMYWEAKDNWWRATVGDYLICSHDPSECVNGLLLMIVQDSTRKGHEARKQAQTVQ